MRQLQWKKFNALKELKQWQASIDIATSLVVDRPSDGDFWYWRAQSLVEMKRFAEAAADFRQSIASRDLRRTNGTDVRALAEIAKEIQRPCEGAFALGALREGSTKMAASAVSLHAELSVLGDCGQLAGKGATKLTAKDGQPIFRASAEVGGQRGEFLVDKHTAYVTVTRAFAERAGLIGSPPEVSIWTAFELKSAELTVAPSVILGRASAPQVDVAIVDSLPPGVDGVIGLTFLWRFSFDDDGGELVLRER